MIHQKGAGVRYEKARLQSQQLDQVSITNNTGNLIAITSDRRNPQIHKPEQPQTEATAPKIALTRIAKKPTKIAYSIDA